MASLLEKLLRSGDQKVLKQLRAYTEAVNSLEDSFVAMSDVELRAETDAFRKRVEDGESLDLLLPEAFAVVREASKRTLGKRHYDVQLMGGAALHLGNIAEMKTGEGKTLVATAPAYLNALSGKGVHVVTVNDYLAEYQANLMGRVFRSRALSWLTKPPMCAVNSTKPTSPTAPTTSSALTTCVTIWPGPKRNRCSAAITLPSSMRSTLF